MSKSELLRFQKSNAKLDALQKLTGKTVWVFSILSGKSCPFADKCKAWAHEENGKLTLVSGPNQEYRCYSASEEARLPSVYKSRKGNFDLLVSCKSKEEMVDLIDRSLPKSDKPYIVRWHSAGDFWSLSYLDALLEICRRYPQHTFYCYTKSIPYIVERLKDLPANFLYTCSRGGRRDDLIDKHKLRSVTIVKSKLQARSMGLPVDHDDRHAALKKYAGQDFSLVVHAVQGNKNDKQKAFSRAWSRLKKAGQGGYSRVKAAKKGRK